jgi:hypothetical protein
MVIQKDRIRLIHENRTALLNRMFNELSRKPPDSSAETVFHEIITTARVIQNALSKSEEILHPARGIFVLALQHVVDSFIAGLLTDEAFKWLAEATKASGSDSLMASARVGGLQVSKRP